MEVLNFAHKNMKALFFKPDINIQTKIKGRK